MHKFNVTTPLKNEFSRFGNTLSIKGVPKIFNSRETLLRITWWFVLEQISQSYILLEIITNKKVLVCETKETYHLRRTTFLAPSWLQKEEAGGEGERIPILAGGGRGGEGGYLCPGQWVAGGRVPLSWPGGGKKVPLTWSRSTTPSLPLAGGQTENINFPIL